MANKDLYPDLDSALDDVYQRNVQAGAAEPIEVTTGLESQVAESLDTPQVPKMPDEFMGVQFTAQRGEVAIPIQDFNVLLPEVPMSINGRYFGFEVDAAKLISVVAKANKALNQHYNPIESLAITLDDQLEPQISTEPPKHRVYSPEPNRLDIILPARVEDTDMPLVELIGDVEENLNLQIETGILTSVARTVRTERVLTVAKGMLVTVAPVSGIVFGLEVPAEFGPSAMGGLGVALGELALTLGLAYGYQKSFDSGTQEWAKKRLGKKDSWHRQQAIDDEALASPIIKVVPSPWAPPQPTS